jgi:hypothetical protein
MRLRGGDVIDAAATPTVSLPLEELRRLFPGRHVDARPVTLHPALAEVLGPRLSAPLRAVRPRPLCSHLMAIVRKPA